MAAPRLKLLMAGAALAGVLSIVTPGVAHSHSDGESTTIEGKKPDEKKSGEKAAESSLAAKRDKCLRQIDKRVEDLVKLLATYPKATSLTTAHRNTLTAVATESKDWLGVLRAEIETDTDLTELKADCQRIYTEFRIYALRLPQAHLVLAADAAQAKQAKFDDLIAQLELAITEAGGDPDVAEAQARLEKLKAHVAAGMAASAGVADGVIGLTPADWNANRKVLKPFVAQMRDAQKSLKAAAKEAHKILALLGDSETPSESKHA